MPQVPCTSVSTGPQFYTKCLSRRALNSEEKRLSYCAQHIKGVFVPRVPLNSFVLQASARQRVPRSGIASVDPIVE